jgi:Flp pilus assembly pilin Flp
MKLLPLLKKLRRDERGISAVEYAILLGVVGVGAVAALSAVSGNMKQYVADQMATVSKDGNTALGKANDAVTGVPKQ